MTEIGSKMTRRDARVRATGEVKFTEDLIVSGKLHAVLVRSPVASARIVKIDTAAAEETQGVVCVLKGKDVTDR
ncbi:MAG: aldehyde oxidase, partial [Gammaproteobacteria bacterium]